MAKVKITGHASGTGILTVTAPNTSTDRTITLPDATGTLLNSDGSGASLTALNATNLGSGTVPTARLGSGTANSSVHLRGDGTWAAAGGGKVLQVVGGTDQATGSITATSFTDAGSSLAITPSATSSKILVLFSGHPRMYSASQDPQSVWTVYRAISGGATTNLGDSSAGFVYPYTNGSGSWDSKTINICYLDSPNTTSAITYTIYGKMLASSSQCNLGTGGEYNTWTLLEIGV